MNCNCKKETCTCNLNAVGCANSEKCTELIGAKCVLFDLNENSICKNTLSCIDVPDNTNLKVILKKFDDKLCSLMNGTDTFVKISALDTSTGYLIDKLAKSDCIALTKVNPGANEKLKIDITVDPDPTNDLECRINGLYSKGAPDSYQLKVDATDTCPSLYLDDKISNELTSLSGTIGYGGHCGAVIIHGVPAPGLTQTRVVTVTIGGNTYNNPSAQLVIGNCDGLIFVLNNIFRINNLPYHAYSNGATTVASSQTSCAVCISGIDPLDAVAINGYNETFDFPNNTIVNFSSPLSYNIDALDPKYFSTVYKRIDDDGNGCKTISLHAHNQEATEEFQGCNTIGWLPVPNSALRNNWLSTRLLYKITDGVIEFRGIIYKALPIFSTIGLTGTVTLETPYSTKYVDTEEILDVRSINPLCIPSFNLTDFGLVEYNAQLDETYSYGGATKSDKTLAFYSGYLQTTGTSFQLYHVVDVERIDEGNIPLPAMSNYPVNFEKQYTVSMEGVKLYL